MPFVLMLCEFAPKLIIDHDSKGTTISFVFRFFNKNSCIRHFLVKETSAYISCEMSVYRTEINAR